VLHRSRCANNEKKKLRSLETTRIYPEHLIRPKSLDRATEDEGRSAVKSRNPKVLMNASAICYVCIFCELPLCGWKGIRTSADGNLSY